MPRDKKRRKGNRYPLLGIALILLVVVAGVYALVLDRNSGSALKTVSPAGRLVVVANGTVPLAPKVADLNCLRFPDCRNGAGGTELVQLVKGTVALEVQSGRVLTDESCTPDKYGISHCLNKIELANGMTLVVRHNHNMMNDPCLSPGERIRVEPLKMFLQS